MKEALKTVSFYLVGLLGLIVVTVIYTARDDLAEYRELPTDKVASGLITPTIVRQATPGPTPTLVVTEPDACAPTPGTTQYGYVSNTPLTTKLVPPHLNLPGSPLLVFGTVYAADCVTRLPDTLIEVWQADVAGHYDDSAPFILRGQMRTDDRGRYQFTSIKPGPSQRNVETIPANIHFRVSYKDQPALYTQLFFAGDPMLARSALAKPPLITRLTEQVGAEGTLLLLRGEFDIVLPVESPNLSSGS